MPIRSMSSISLRMSSALFCLLAFSNLYAEELPHKPSPEMEKSMASSNKKIANRLPPLLFERAADHLPYAEYDPAGYLIFSADFNFNSENVKVTLLKNLPETMTAVIFTGRNSSGEIERLQRKFSEFIPADRLKIIYLPGANSGFWARDGIPVPMVKKSDQSLSLVDARYYYPFEPDQQVATLFESELFRHDYYFEGGNFIANRLGDCLIVNKTATQEIPDSIFTTKYGCKTLLRLPHIKGIGHADESVKFVDDQTVLTDATQYVPLLEEKGFKVVTLPRPRNRYETYVNSLIIDRNVFIPVFDQEKDQEVIETYRGLGFNPIPLNTETLSNRGMGSIHCITMTYPPAPFHDLLKAIGGHEIQ